MCRGTIAYRICRARPHSFYKQVIVIDPPEVAGGLQGGTDLLFTRMRAVLLVATFWAAAWVVVGLALVVRLATLESGALPARVVWLTSIVVPRSASIGFACGTAFSVALLVLGGRGVRDASVRLGGSLAAAILGSLASGRLGLEPVALAALVCGSCAAACAVVSLAIASREHRPSTSGSAAHRNER